MSRALKFLMFIYFVVFLTTGAFMILIVNADEGSQPWIALLVRNHGIVFVWHLACWMVMGTRSRMMIRFPMRRGCCGKARSWL